MQQLTNIKSENESELFLKTGSQAYVTSFIEYM